MNCLEYRRLLLAGDGESAAMRSHRLRCGACAELARDQEDFEARLRRGLEVPLPAGLEDRLAAASTRQRRRFLAAAALSAAALGAGSWAWLARRDGPVAMASIDFVMKEEAKSIMMGAVPRAEAEAALAPVLPLARMERVGDVRHVRPCPFNGAMAYHVVLSVPQGKVTLLVMPDSSVAREEHADHEGMHAAVMPLAKGSVGIVGYDRSVVASVAGALLA